jgi:hypothetical protein
VIAPSDRWLELLSDHRTEAVPWTSAISTCCSPAHIRSSSCVPPAPKPIARIRSPLPAVELRGRCDSADRSLNRVGYGEHTDSDGKHRSAAAPLSGASREPVSQWMPAERRRQPEPESPHGAPPISPRPEPRVHDNLISSRVTDAAGKRRTTAPPCTRTGPDRGSTARGFANVL